MMPYLSLLIFVPLLVGIGLAFTPGPASKVAKYLSGLVALGTLVISGVMTSTFVGNDSSTRFTQKYSWITSLNITYSVGIDSMAAWMITLSSFLAVVAIAISKPTDRTNQFYGLLLCLLGTLVGVFSSLDLILFYIFFELSLVPVALLILGWGSGDRGKVAMRYLAVLVAGSLLMLVGILIVGNQAYKLTGTPEFDVNALKTMAAGSLWKDSWPLQSLAFWGFMIAFLVKSPAVPVHRWLADTYEDAPVGAVVAGVVLKVGTFGMFRFVLPLFPEACQVFAPVIVGIGVLGILYGGILAVVQKNPGRLMAYSTVSHVGYILVGMFSLNQLGMMGAAFQQFNHGLAAAAVFVLLNFLYQRTDIRSLDQFGGLKKSMPVFATLFLVAMLTNLGLPFTSGFIGEVLALLGAFISGNSGAFGLSVVPAVVATGGAILSAAYMLYMYQRLFYGKPKAELTLPDLNVREMAVGGVFAVILIGLGIFPTPVLSSMESRVQAIQADVSLKREDLRSQQTLKAAPTPPTTTSTEEPKR